MDITSLSKTEIYPAAAKAGGSTTKAHSGFQTVRRPYLFNIGVEEALPTTFHQRRDPLKAVFLHMRRHTL